MISTCRRCMKNHCMRQIVKHLQQTCLCLKHPSTLLRHSSCLRLATGPLSSAAIGQGNGASMDTVAKGDCGWRAGPDRVRAVLPRLCPTPGRRSSAAAWAGRPQQQLQQEDTIFALSSGQGKCGLAVIRVSGPQASLSVLAMTRLMALPDAKKLILSRLHSPADGQTIDKGLVVWFPGPGSFTGEDVAEFHVHGGPAVVSAMHSALDGMRGLRHAQPGEFTKRAFLNGKLDLTEVEGLSDLIHAETEAQRRQALRQLEGDLGRMYEDWRTRLIKCLAHVEAYIDFSEDENIEEGVLGAARAGVGELLQRVSSHLDDNRRGERLRSGVQVAIIGRPNVGKSSLLNLLCQRPAAIVTPIAGTTRDVIETPVNIGGYPVLLLDTAGLRDTEDVVEKEGVRRARQRAIDADITVVMADASELVIDKASASSADGVGGNATAILEGSLCQTLDQTADGSSEREAGGFGKDTIVAINKSDLVEEGAGADALASFVETSGEEERGSRGGRRAVCVMSCKTEEGLESFLEILTSRVKALCGNPLAGNPSLTQARHRSNLMRCAASLESFLCQSDLVMAAEHLRVALQHLGQITGRVGLEEVLDVVFKDFCIGK